MQMPETGQLPDGLQDFAYLQAVTVDGGRDFDHHVDGLIRSLDQIFAAAAGSSSLLESGNTETARIGAESFVAERLRVDGKVKPVRRVPALRYGLAGGLTVAVLVL